MNTGTPLESALEAAVSLRSSLMLLSDYFMQHGEARRAEAVNHYVGWLDGVELHLECLKPAEREETVEQVLVSQAVI
jgi:hypothetical protein